MKVIILTDSRITRQHFLDLHYNQISSEFETEVWDMSYVFSKEGVDNEFNEHEVLKIFDKEMLRRELNRVKKQGCIIISKAYPPKYKVIKNIIKDYDVDFVCIDKDVTGCYWEYKAISDFGLKYSLWDWIKAKSQVNRYTRYFINRIILRIPAYDYLLTPKAVYNESARRIIPIHHIKYDEYLSTEDETIVNGKYALFIDTAAVDHPIYKGAFNEEEKKRYYGLIREYLDRFEKHHKINVVIAGYPKIKNKEGIFGNRAVYYFKTAQLIKNADIVISQYSTSIVTALFANKPIVFIFSKMLLSNKKTRMSQFMVFEMAKELGTSCDCIENNTDFSVVSINTDAYQKYISEYMIRDDLSEYTNGELINAFLHKYMDSKFGR